MPWKGIFRTKVEMISNIICCIISNILLQYFDAFLFDNTCNKKWNSFLSVFTLPSFSFGLQSENGHVGIFVVIWYVEWSLNIILMFIQLHDSYIIIFNWVIEWYVMSYSYNRNCFIYKENFDCYWLFSKEKNDAM